MKKRRTFEIFQPLSYIQPVERFYHCYFPFINRFIHANLSYNSIPPCPQVLVAFVSIACLFILSSSYGFIGLWVALSIYMTLRAVAGFWR